MHFSGMRIAGFVVALVVLQTKAAEVMAPVVDVEETVYSYTPANNGAGPMWCHGSTCLVRVGDRTFVTGLETVPGAQPLNNCRWVLWERTHGGWVRRFTDVGRTREPSPLAAFPSGELWVSANPTLAPDRPEPGGGPARPEVVRFAASAPMQPAIAEVPVWDGAPRFTEHSYRSLAADAAARELVVFQNIDYTHAEWSFRDRDGRWSAHGKLRWPWGSEYPKPQPIRVCYPNVAVKGRAVHFFGVSDIQEPNPAWREFKHALTGQHWDYDFRRLFYTWTPDVTREPFRDWLEIASRERTAGSTAVCDLHLAPDGAVHLIWTERALDERLRERFFPAEKQSHSLHHAVLRDGAVVRRTLLFESTEARPGVIASAARFQPAPDGRLYVCFYAGGVDEAGRPLSENRVMELKPDGTPGPAARIPLSQPFTAWFTATPRAGSPPSRTVEVLGVQRGFENTIRYARIRLEP